MIATVAAAPGLLAARGGPGLDRGAPGARDRLIARVRSEAADDGDEGALTRWRRLAALGRQDLALGRLSEGHLDATAILRQSGRQPEPHAVYGVWASASGRTGLDAGPTGAPDARWRVCGRMRFCSGAPWIDRALVTARTAGGELLLFDTRVQGRGWRPVAGTWPAVGMDLSESLDVDVDTVVAADAQVGEAGFYLGRPGFALGGIGVAAVWLGGAAGLVDVVADGLRGKAADPHQLAHLGAMHVALAAADAQIVRASQVDPGAPSAHLAALALLTRSAADAAVGEVLRRMPRVTGPTPLTRSADVAHRLADLEIYVRQHHAERDLATLGETVLALDHYGTGSTSGAR